MLGRWHFVAVLAVSLPIGGCAWLTYEVLNPDMRGPRGYYVQVEDPSVYIEFFEKPEARSNVVKEAGDARYWFSAFDSEIDMHGPIGAPKEQRRRYYIYGEGNHIRVQDRSAKPVPPGRFYPVTHYVRRKK